MSEIAAQKSVPVARGVLAEQHDGKIVLSVPETDYRVHLNVYQPLSTAIGKRITGTIRAHSRRLDVVRTGGKYIEPVFGRPRRVQGVILAVNPAENTVTVDASLPMVLRLESGQKADALHVGDFVSGDVLDGASFTPASS